MVRSNLVPLAAVVLCGALCSSWKFFNSEEDKKQKVDEFLNSVASIPDPRLIESLREEKQAGVNWLYSTYWKSQLNYENYKSNKKFLKLFDKVSGQKDAISSRLFWYTDFEQAVVQAKKQHKPLLCLEMLGDLSEDFSCANSRFFRTLLYSNPSISYVMRENFILCWEPVVKVPKVTIEYPDGRKQVQTITGNSMHMVLNEEGEILDALPGLFGPVYFENWLRGFVNKTDISSIREVQKKRITELENNTLREKLGNEDWNQLVEENEGGTTSNALKASSVSVSKIAIERPVYRKVYGVSKKKIKTPEEKGQNSFNYSAFGYNWEFLPSSTQQLIAAKKRYTAEEQNSTVSSICENLSKENVRNDVNLHTTILRWLQKPEFAGNKKQFVQKVYADLFLTPLNDKTMGLYDKSLYSATTDDGFLEE
jgi:hypothetical protein